MLYLLDGQETERLNFKLLEPSDFDDWVELFKATEILKFIGQDEKTKPEELCEKWFEKIFDRYQNDLGGMNVLIDKNTNSLIGQCGLLVQEVDSIQELEIGYSILPKFWNKGYATEAAIKCKEVAFSNNYSDSLISIIHTENIGSKKVAINNGMKLDKTTIFKDMQVNIF